MDLLTIAGLLGVLYLAAYVYRYFTEFHNFFEEQGIPYLKPVPIFGSWWGAWKRVDYHLIEMERYKKYGQVFGMFHGRIPTVMVSDPNLLKKIFVKDFEHFVNHEDFAVLSDYVNRNLFQIGGGEWKELRSAMTPAFTTGKIRKMVALMTEPAEALVKHLHEFPENSKINIKQKVSSFALDVIATCGFGIKVDCVSNPEHPFAVNASKTFNPEEQTSVLMILSNLYPQLSKYLLPKSAGESFEFFADVARKIVNERKSQPKDAPKRNDFVDLILEAAETNSILQDEVTLLAQMILFLFAGFDTTGFTMTTTLHFLALNPTIQEKVRKEIKETVSRHNGEITYEVIRELPYLDQCISEAQRLYPIFTRLGRMCTKDIEYKEFKLKKGMLAFIPVYSIHMDPKYYPNPEKYDPDRFSPEEKGKRDPVLFLPFGYGNRNCIGMRFALDNMKFGFSHLLLNFKFVPVPETENPPKITVGTIGFMQAREFYLGVEKLKN